MKRMLSNNNLAVQQAVPFSPKATGGSFTLPNLQLATSNEGAQGGKEEELVENDTPKNLSFKRRQPVSSGFKLSFCQAAGDSTP